MHHIWKQHALEYNMGCDRRPLNAIIQSDTMRFGHRIPHEKKVGQNAHPWTHTQTRSVTQWREHENVTIMLSLWQRSDAHRYQRSIDKTDFHMPSYARTSSNILIKIVSHLLISNGRMHGLCNSITASHLLTVEKCKWNNYHQLENEVSMHTNAWQ